MSHATQPNKLCWVVAFATYIFSKLSHADSLARKLARCRGIRRIVQQLNVLLRVQAPDE